MTAVEIAAAVRAGERSARDVVEEHLAQIEAREAELHAFNHVLADEARAAADAVDASVGRGDDPGPLAGVPVALKDNMCTRGIPTTCSSKILEGWRPPYSATVVDRALPPAVSRSQDQPRRVRHGSSTENCFGPTCNLRRPDRVPRLERRVRSRVGPLSPPSAWLGHRRLDPPAGGAERGRRDQADLRPCSRHGRSRSQLARPDRPLTESVDDAVVARGDRRHDPLDSTSIAEPAPSVREAAGAGADGLRVGIVEELTDASGVHPDVAAAVEQAVRREGRRTVEGCRCRARRTAVGVLPHRRSRRRATSPATTASVTGCGSTGPTPPP
jgi:aspartyl-tRNA(Asn)/glutamyl-tRNA(Gln) amidotransferase subunit A